MAHFAQLSENNTVIQVVVISNDDIQNLDFPESEPIGIAFCKQLFGQDTNWVQTSYNASFRKNYAEIGGQYDQSRDAFIPVKNSLYPSWVLDETTCRWIAPIPYPTDGGDYIWDEPTLNWKLRP